MWGIEMKNWKETFHLLKVDLRRLNQFSDNCDDNDGHIDDNDVYDNDDDCNIYDDNDWQWWQKLLFFCIITRDVVFGI